MPLVPSATEQQICLDRCGADGPPMYASRLFMRVSTSLSLGPSHSTTLQSYPELCQVLTATNPPRWQRMPELQEGGVSDLLLGPIATLLLTTLTQIKSQLCFTTTKLLNSSHVEATVLVWPESRYLEYWQ